MQHLDEGMIHAWLDGQLPPSEAAAVEAHVTECRPCADTVAEARGLIAASSRILTMLDGAPKGVIPDASVEGSQESPVEVGAGGAARSARHRRWFRGPQLAAAAMLLVAVGTFAVVRQRGVSDSPQLLSTDAAAPAPGGASSARADGSARPAPSLATAGAGRPSDAPAAPPAPAVPNDERVVGAARALADSTMFRAEAPRPDTSARDRVFAVTGRDTTRAALNEARESAARAAVAEAPPARRAERQADSGARAAMDSFARVAKAHDSLGAAAVRDRAAPDTARVQIFRGAKAETSAARQRVAEDATGAVVGRVTDGNGRGLGAAQVRVSGTAIGAATDSSGSFTLAGVPTGTRSISVRSIGFAPSERTVEVAAADSVRMNVTLQPTATSLSEVVVTGTAGERRERMGSAVARAPAVQPAADAAAGQAAPQPAWFGSCLDLGITPVQGVSRTGFVEVPRRIALDSMPLIQRADGDWHPVRDLAPRPGSVTVGVWRPASPEVIELEWTYGSRIARLRLSGSPVLRGSLQEIDNAAVTGQAASVVAVRRGC